MQISDVFAIAIAILSGTLAYAILSLFEDMFETRGQRQFFENVRTAVTIIVTFAISFFPT